MTFAMKLVHSLATHSRRALLRCLPSLVPAFMVSCSAGNDLAGSMPGDASIQHGSPDAAPDGATAVGPRIDAPLWKTNDAAVPPSVDGGVAPPPPAACTPSTSTLLARPSEALLVQDRSTAMAEVLASGTSKWAIATSAIEQASSSESTAWGLMLYPKPGVDCCLMPTDDLSPQVEVPPDLRSSASMGLAFGQAPATGIGRPMARAIAQAGNYLSARSTSTSKYLVLVAAAEPTCANDDLCSDADNSRAKDAVTHAASLLGIPVAVVAVALTPSSNSLQTGKAQQFFTDLAKVGGMANTSPNQAAYFAPASSSELAASLASIASKMRSCSFSIASPATYTANVQVTLANVRIPQDVTHQNGWDFGDGGTSVVLYGKPCADVRGASTTTSIQFTSFCPQAVF